MEGAHLAASRHDPGNDAIEIAKHVTRGNSHHRKSFCSQKRVASRIAPRLVATIMSFAVHLDHQPMAEAGEISGDLPDRKLRSKFQPARALAERFQKNDFGQAELATKFAGALNLLDWDLEDAWAPSTKLHLVPLPVSGRICHILNTPKRAFSSIGALRHAANASPNTSLVCAGSMMPSSHSRAVACHGLPWAS